MRSLLVAGLIVLVLILLAPAASANWCSPQYATCGNDDNDGGVGGDPSDGGSANIPRNGDKHYGSDFEQCLASYASGSYCYECAVNLNNNAPQCSGVRHQAKCGCTINYTNYIAVSCRTNGYCEYMWQ